MFNQKILTAPKVSESSHGVGYDTFISRGFIFSIMGLKVNLIGQKFNRLTVIAEALKQQTDPPDL